MTGPAVVVLALVLAYLGALVDVLTGPGLRTGFAVALIVGSVLGALRVRRDHLLVAALMPPLVYLAVTVTTGVARSSGSGSFLVRQAMDLFTALVLDAPALLLASAAALLITLARGLGRRRRPEARPLSGSAERIS